MPSAQPPVVPDPSREMERKVAELEKRLQEEREKVLLAGLKSQEEATYAARVETAIQEVQEKLRRDRHDAEAEENRLKQEARIQELEQRLVQERETWVTTLKGQVRTRETQDHEIEAHFTLRLQEMERRWLEEKAHWQKVVLSKDAELRDLRAPAERLKVVEAELQKTAQEKKYIEEKAAALAGEAASAQARLRATEEKEREYYQVKAEATLAREQARLLQERLEHDLQAARSSAKEREERLLADNERLSREVQGIAERVRHDAELEVRRHQAESNMAQAALQRLRAVAGTLERQAAAFKVQAEQSAKAKAESDRVSERYKAEFMVLQRRWQEREEELRRQLEEEFQRKAEGLPRELQRAQQADIEAGCKGELEKTLADVQAELRAVSDLRRKEEAARREIETRLQALEAGPYPAGTADWERGRPPAPPKPEAR